MIIPPWAIVITPKDGVSMSNKIRSEIEKLSPFEGGTPLFHDEKSDQRCKLGKSHGHGFPFIKLVNDINSINDLTWDIFS